MKNTILKWFDLLTLPQEWKDEVEIAADSFDPATIEMNELPYAWLNEQDDKMLCLLYALYKCEDFFTKARTERDIPEDILFASLSEVKRYALEYNAMTKGEKLGIRQINWIGKILNGNIYRLGRLEFELRGSLYGSEKHRVAAGDSIIAVHIPNNGGPFTEEACEHAYKLAEDFFIKYFPEYRYEYYTCHSWLLDPTLKQFLKPTSNIVKFIDTFDVTYTHDSVAAVTYLFGRGTTVEDLKDITPSTSLQKSVIEHLNNGGKLYEGFGLRRRYPEVDREYVEKTVLKWYDALQFPAEWRNATLDALKSFDPIPLDAKEKPYQWLFEQENKMTGMLYALWKCEDFYNNGLKKGIPESILIDTMQEVRRHSQNYYRSTNEKKIGLYQVRWAGTVISGRLYCLGRLEFEMRTTKKTWEKGGLTPGDNVISVHIPRTGGAMTDEEVEKSFALAAEFFPKYFPDFEYECYMCHSWLLDPTLKKLLKPESNILKFSNRFDVTETNDSTSGIAIIFGSGTTYETVPEKTPQTSLQKAAQEHIRNGGKLYDGYGFMKK